MSGLIVEFHKRHPEVRLAYLFGSYADGNPRADSDVDVAVLLREGADPLLDLRLADALASSLDCRVDVVVLNRVSPILQHEVVRRGKRLFEASAMERRLYELRAFRDYVDAIYFQDRRAGRFAHG